LASVPGAIPGYRLGGLADHLVQGFYVRLPELSLGGLPPGSYAGVGEEQARSYPRVDVRRYRPGEVLVDVRVTGEQSPRPDSYVECLPGPSRPWRVRVHSRPGTSDREVFAAQQAMLQDIWRALADLAGASVEPLAFCDVENPARTNVSADPEFLSALPQGRPVTWTSLLGTEDHEGGTLPLGAILDDWHEFRAVPGLFAAGPSTFPRIGAANPALTTLALAHRLAAVIAARTGAAR
jgi:choline dehydrogenase-like flavoprotein